MDRIELRTVKRYEKALKEIAWGRVDNSTRNHVSDRRLRRKELKEIAKKALQCRRAEDLETTRP